MTPVDEVALARIVAAERRAVHGREQTDADDQEFIGSLGEVHFGNWAGLEVDRTPRPHGDDGIDFVVHVNGSNVTIDVKTYRAPRHLPVQVSHIDRVADLLVLCRYEHGRCRLVAWEHGWTMRLMPIGRLPNQSILNHLRPVDQLRPIPQLRRLLDLR